MATTSYGYDGPLLEGGWAKISKYLGRERAVGGLTHLLVTTVAGVDRTVKVAVGEGFGHGVLDVVDADVNIQSDTLASGTRWDTIVIRRNWQTNSTTFVVVAGTATMAVAAGLNNTPGTIHDDPIALVQITSGQQVPTAVVDLRAPTSGDDTEVGVEAYFPVATPPERWAARNGQALNRVKHAKLFTLIGTTYGAGDGSTTFNLPNASGRVDVGLDAAQAEFDVVGETGGAKTHTLTLAQTPSHAHDLTHGHTGSSANASVNHSHTIYHGHGRAYGATYGGAGAHGHNVQTIVRSIYAAGGANAGMYQGGSIATDTQGAHDHSCYADVGGSDTASSGASDPVHSHGVTVNNAGGNTNAQGGGGSHPILQPYLVGVPVIKVL